MNKYHLIAVLTFIVISYNSLHSSDMCIVYDTGLRVSGTWNSIEIHMRDDVIVMNIRKAYNGELLEVLPLGEASRGEKNLFLGLSEINVAASNSVDDSTITLIIESKVVFKLGETEFRHLDSKRGLGEYKKIKMWLEKIPENWIRQRAETVNGKIEDALKRTNIK